MANRQVEDRHLPFWRVALIFIVAGLLALLVLSQVLTPLRREIAVRYLNRGDSYLASLDFAGAEREYERALKYDRTLEEANQHLELAKQGPTDIAKVRDFFFEHSVTHAVEKIDAATRRFANPKEALTEGASLYSQGEFVYARYPLEAAVRLDEAYPEAWHYLFLTYTELAKEDADYREKADEARNRRDALTSRYLIEEEPGVE